MQCSHRSNSIPSILSRQVEKSLAKMGFEGSKKGTTARKQAVLGWRKAKMEIAMSTESAMANGAEVLRQPQGDLTAPHDGFSMVGKAISAKSNYIVCKECAQKRERGEGPSAFHCCRFDLVVVGLRTKAGSISHPSRSLCGPSDQVMVELRTEAGPVSPPSPKKSNPSPSATENTGWTSWDWSCLCVHAHLGMPTCGCSNSLRNSVVSTKKPY